MDAIVVEDLLHLFEAVLFENMFEVVMPEAKALEPSSGSRFHTIFEIERTIFPVGVRKSRRDRPVRSQQIDAR